MTDAILERLDRARERLDRMTQKPDEVAGLWIRLVTPVLRLVGWQARFESAELFVLLDRTVDPARDDHLKRAVGELEHNIALAERACSVDRYVPTAHASWLYRVERLLRGVADLGRTPGDAATRVLRGLDRTHVLPPLRVLETSDPAAEAKGDHAQGATAKKHRILELELAAIDHIIDAARAETRSIGRRRALLEGARRLLLDASAALPLDPEGLIARREHLAKEITKLDRFEAAGLSPNVAIAYQAKQALRRGDRDRLYAALVALDGFAVAAGDATIAARTNRALESLGAGGVDHTGGSGEAARSAEQIFGRDVVETIRAQYATLRAESEAGQTDPELTRLALEYLAPGTEDAALSALISVDGCFEVGASLSPVRVRETQEVARLVSHPTPELLLVPATDVSDIPTAIVSDPRSVLLDLASGRLLARKYVERRRREVQRTKLVGEVRVFVLDGSTSMLEDGKEGARARVRDAVLLAELATLMRRLSAGSREVRLSLFYRFFTKRLGELHRVATPSEALAAMADVVGKARKGGTDIQQALVMSMQLIRDKKREDPDLARAGIVLVTDGNAPVDPEAVRAAREEAGDVAISISVIALGEENPVLRDLVARQRARGERAFYHHLGDDELAALCRGEALGPRIAAAAAPFEPGAFKREVEDVLLELEDLDRERTKDRATDGAQGRSAKEEVTARDRASLDRRYDRWFPAIAAQPAEASDADADDRDAARVVLVSVAEVVGELGSDPLRRRADAIELVERLLPDARLSPARFHELIERRLLQPELHAIHQAVRGARESFDDRLSRSKAHDHRQPRPLRSAHPRSR